MGLFRKVNNTAAGTLPATQRPLVQPGPTNIHHHGVNWPAVVIVVFGCIILLGPASWFALVYLFDRLGSRSPEAHAAGLLIFVPLAFAFLWFVSWIVGPHLDRHYAHLDFTEEQRTERERVRLLAAQTSIDPGRFTEADFQFARVILACMMIAYKWIEDHNGIPFSGRWRPWSMRSAKEAANGIGVKLTDAQANGVSLWLHDKGVITSPDGGQITQTYPDLSNVRLLLDKEFGKPIVVVSPALRENRGFEHI